MTTALEQLIDSNGWMDIPDEVISTEGRRVDTSLDDWTVLLPSGRRLLRFSQVSNQYVRWSLKRYAIKLLSTTSSHSAVQFFEDFKANINNRKELSINLDLSGDELRERLIEVMQSFIYRHRENHTMYQIYRVVQWYIWCADNIPELGFDPTYADELAALTIPGNPKGEAVSQEDPTEGPLDRTLELPLLFQALSEDTSTEYTHLQEKAALALCLAFGRNPLNFAWLNESDFYNLTEDVEHVDDCYIIRIPRIKKRQGHPRHDFIEEKIDPRYAYHVQALIEANQAFDSEVETEIGVITVDRPLFRVRRQRVASRDAAEWALRRKPQDIGSLLRQFVIRHQIQSPVTGNVLNLTPRRLRYTLATGLVEDGISRRELAKVLDHSDMQHVEVYFELARNVVTYLDAAMAKSMSHYFDHFHGKVVEDDSHAINGEREDKHLSFRSEDDPADETDIGVCGYGALCDLDPPFSCYLCPLFQPYRHANHEHVLELLVDTRQKRLKKYETNRLGIQLDDVILAVGRVVGACEEANDG